MSESEWQLLFATSSDTKFNEALKVFPRLSRVVVDLPEIQSIDQREILDAKLDAAVQAGHDRVLVEDTGLELDALGGLPGPFIKFFIKKLSAHGLYEIASKVGRLQARAVTVAACSINGQRFFGRGEVSGTVVAPRGKGGFGFDPIFEPSGLNVTYAEMSEEQKSSISHRACAMRSLRDALEQSIRD
jgi:inosine triphosphate pyrophosphatase